MNKLILILSLIASACGPVPKSLDKQFLIYTQRFYSHTNIIPDVPIKFANLGDYAGVCYVYSTGEREIEIDTFFWNESSDLAKEELIFHELGHCVLNRDHDSTLVKTDDYEYKIPNSIMYPYAFGYADFYNRYHQHYMDELIDAGKKL